MQAEYLDGVLDHAVLNCPFGEPGEACWVSRHGVRARKTGPPHPIVVVYCNVHERFFSVYPPGFTPYARRQMVSGTALYDEPSLVDVVEDAAANGPVDRESSKELSWSTQNRLVSRVAALFGLDDAALRQAISTRVSVRLLQLEVAARTHGVQARGQALRGLLRELCADVLLGLGALVGLWGPPHRWCSHSDRLVPMGLSP